MADASAMATGADPAIDFLADERFAADYFTLFALPPEFSLDAAALERAYRQLQAQTHPDRFVTAGDGERRRALQWATRVNEAYQTLRKPLPRARYLLALLGGEADFASENRALPTDFLIEQMELREAVAEAAAARRGDELDRLRDELVQALRRRYDELAAVFVAVAADADADARAAALALAADRIRRLMFEEKLLADIDDAQAALDDLSDD